MRSLGRALRIVPALAFGFLAYVYLALPDVRPLRESNPETTAFVELRAREARARGARARSVQRWVPYNRISDQLKRAVLVAEDSAFWDHEGIDLEQLQKSLEINIEQGRIARGGSTITQQLAKNLYLSPSRDPLRKLRELMIARRLEAELSKRRILELYLNAIEWGDGIYGAEAASRAYFGKGAASLGPSEAALLAGSIINPRVYSPASPNARLLRRQRLIRSRMGFYEPPPSLPAVAETPPSPGPLPAAAPVLPSTLPGASITLAPPPPPKKPGGGGQ